MSSTDHANGWAASTLRRALHVGVLQGVAFLGFVMVVAAFLTPATEANRWWLVPLQVTFALGALASASGRPAALAVAWAAAVVLPATWIADAQSASPMTFTTIWLLHVTNFVAAAIARGRLARLASIVLAVGMPISMAVIRPDWTAQIAIPVAIAALAVRWAGQRLLPRLESFAARIDAEIDADLHEQRALIATRAAAAESAEQARLLHDTVVNTLAALANGIPGSIEAAVVRDRCRRDVETLEALISGQDGPPRLRLEELTSELGLDLRRTGLDDARFHDLAADLPPRVARAMVGATREAIRNVAKHAGISEVQVEISGGAELLIAVADHGRGFDGAIPAGRGLARSVVARSEEAGVRATVTTEIGAGTQVVLRYPLEAASHLDDKEISSDDTDADAGTVIERIIDQGSWLWCAGVFGIGMVIEPLSRLGRLTPTYAMLGLVAIVTLISHRSMRGGRTTLPTPVAALVVLSVPALFVLGAAGPDFGRNDPTAWQALGVTAGLVIVLAHGRTRVPFAVATVALVATAAITTALVAQSDPRAAAVIPMGAAPALAVVIGWVRFQSVLTLVGRRAAEEHRRAATARLERAIRESAATARTRWRLAGLTSCSALLRRVASGRLDPSDPAVRSACSAEEVYLRQVSLIDPELVHMGHPLARALAEARARNVRVTARFGRRDVDDPADASALGELLRHVLEATSAGDELVVSLFPSDRGLTFGIVGPTTPVADASSRWTAPSGWRPMIEIHGPIGRLEVSSAGRQTTDGAPEGRARVAVP
jgi:hypothetical protein